MKINQISSELKKIETTFRNLIITSNYQKVSDSEISWHNYTSGIFKNLYAKEYETLVQNRQYSFLLRDKMGFVQFYFKYTDNDAFEKIKMAYYPYPVILKDTVNDIESYYDDSDDRILSEYYFDLWNLLSQEFSLPIDDQALQQIILIFREKLSIEIDLRDLIIQKFDMKYEITNSSHLRVDFDSRVESHHKCEIQIGAVNEIRIPIDRIISPFMFFDFIAKNLYRDFYETLLKKKSFRTNFSISRKNSKKFGDFAEPNIFLTHIDKY